MNHPHPEHAPKKFKIHHDWRFWAVILMILGITIYVVTFDESFGPAGPSQPVPATAP